ncbi:Asp-tRNA(Asn)/Glu-tRNA(Gln) amidotransferase subunit GatB [Candidatus Woesearchaeota archaeon]|nr:Asp-tRNA(Asn)/Glu-tRNA(Gln) amidotransferase subunit GatB [Candidatus Woesearchaeota archaeon]
MKFTTDIVIGLEIHIELNTNTKLFCGCATKGSDEPNSRVCPVCLGHPGSKPVLNKKVVEFATKLGLAMNCKIDKELVFSRKSYFYPDLAKNYQITQYEQPLCKNGSMKLSNGKTIGITRIHVEEDPAALVHPGSIHGSNYVLIDYNRSGNPLCEIVTEPDMASPEEAREFMNKLITILEYLEIFDPDAIIKADANVSVKESGYIRSEIKNITGFKEIERALNYEVQRQKRAVADGEKLIQDTRSWDAEKGMSSRLRTKETEDDYGYIIDPDLVITDITDEFVKNIKDNMPELADEKMEKFKEHGIADDNAEIISKNKDLAKVYELLVKEIDADKVSKWARRDLMKAANYHKKNVADLDLEKVVPKFVSVLKAEISGEINAKIAFMGTSSIVEDPEFDVDKYIGDNKSQGDDSAIEGFVKEVISEQKENVSKYKAGEGKVLNFLVGQVMRKSQGKADAGKIKELLIKCLQ